MAACRAMPPCPRCSERCERAAVNGTPGGAHTSAATSSMAGRITTAENATMLKLYGFSRVNAGARGRTRDLRVLWALEEMRSEEHTSELQSQSNLVCRLLLEK